MVPTAIVQELDSFAPDLSPLGINMSQEMRIPNMTEMNFAYLDKEVSVLDQSEGCCGQIHKLLHKSCKRNTVTDCTLIILMCAFLSGSREFVFLQEVP